MEATLQAAPTVLLGPEETPELWRYLCRGLLLQLGREGLLDPALERASLECLER